MTRSLLLLGTVTLILGGCRGQPEDLFFWVGELRAMDGSPLAGHTLRVERIGNSPCSDIPYPGYPPCEWLDFAEVQTDSEGRYLLELMRFEIETPTERRPFRVSLEDPSGARSDLEIYSGGRDLELPPLVVWPGPVTVEAGADGWSATPPEQLPFAERRAPGTPWVEELTPPGTPHTRYFEWVLEAAGGIAWRELGAEPFVIAPELVEDFADASLRLDGIEWSYPRPVNLINGDAGGSFYVRVRPPTTALVSANILPVSRGLDCRINGFDHSPCPATDGRLEHVLLEPWSGDGFTDVRWFELDLGAPRVPRLVVLRGLRAHGSTPSEEMTISGSADAESWQRLATIPSWYTPEGVYPSPHSSDPLLVVPIDGPDAPVRYLRFAGSLFQGLESVREISVFD